MRIKLRRYSCILMTLVLLLSGFGGITAKEVTAETTEDGLFNYTVFGTGTVGIEHYAGAATNLVIPSEIAGLKVTSIRRCAFLECTSLINVIIPDSVTNIDYGAFWNCTNLVSVEIPNSMKRIGDLAFSSCFALTSIKIPNSVTSIGESAFEGCDGLTSIKIPSSVTSIGDSAFYGCDGLTSIEISNSVTSIGNHTFSSCSSLTSIEIPDSVISIGGSAFSRCSSLTSIKIPDSVISIGDFVFYYCDGLTSIEIPNSVTSIGDSTFEYCNGLTNIEIPNSVTSIGDYAFCGCSGLTSIKIPSGVTSIGECAFERCSSLTSIEIPDSVRSIGNCAFFGCEGLKSITIPSSVTNIGTDALCMCPSTMIVYAVPGSVAANYAKEEGFTVKPIGKNKPTWMTMKQESDAYGFVAVDKNTGEPINNVTWWVGDWNLGQEKTTIGENESQFSFVPTFNGITRQMVFVSKAGYITNHVNIDPIIGKGRTTPVYLTPYAGGVYVDSLQVSTKNQSGTTDKINVMSSKKRIDSNNDSVVYVEATGGCSDENQTIVAFEIAQTEYDNIPTSDIIGKYSINASHTIPIDKFEDGICIYVRGIDNNGKKGEWLKTNLIVQKGISNTNITMDIGSELKFSIPNNVPIIGGKEFEVSGWKDLPVQGSVSEDGTVRLGINLGNIDFMNNDADFSWNEIKDIATKKNLGKKFDKLVKQFDKQRKDAEKRKAFSVGKNKTKASLDVDVWGYLEGNVNRNIEGNYVLEGQLVVELSAGAKTNIPYSLGTLPMVFTLELTGKTTGEMNTQVEFSNISDLEDLDNFGIQGVLKPSITLDIGTGPGFGDLAYVTANVAGTIGSEIEWPALEDGKFSAPNFKNMTAYLSLRASLKAKLLFWSTSLNFAELKRQLYQHTDDASMYVNPLMNKNSYVVDCADVKYTLDNVDSYSMAQLSQIEIGTDGQLIHTNVDSESDVFYAESDGKKIAIYTIQDSSRLDINQNMLVYSIYQESDDTWSEPVAVLDDGTCDYYPSLAYDENNLYLAWVNITNVLSADTVTMEESAAATEVVLTKFDADNQEFVQVYSTDNDTMDYAPSISVQNGVTYMSWISNDNNNLLCNDSANAIKTLRYSSADEITESVTGTELQNVLESAYGVIGDQECVVYIEDGDGDYATAEDRKMHVLDVNGTLLYESKEGETVSHLEFNDLSGNNVLMWNQNQVIYYLNDVTDEATLLIDETSYVSGKYQLQENDKCIYLLFLISKEGDVISTSSLNAYVFDKTMNTWSERIQLSKEELYANSYCANLNTDGTLDVIVSNATVELDGEEYISTSNLYYATTELETDLVLENVAYDDYVTTESGNSVELLLSISNNGEMFLDGYNLQLLKDDVVVDEISDTTVLVPGASCDITKTFVLPDEIGLQEEYTIKLVADNDSNESNNESVITLGYANLDFALGEYTSYDSVHSYSVNVVNKGPVSTDGVVEIRQGGEDGVVVDSITLDTLMPNEQRNILIVINDNEVNWTGDSMQYALVLVSDVEEKDTLLNTEAFYVNKEQALKQAYEISFVSTEVGTTGNVPESIICSAGMEVQLPNFGELTKTGYFVVGWVTEEGVIYKPGDVITINKDMVLHALWQQEGKTENVCLHTDVVVRNAVNGTCEGNGYTGDVYCTFCNECIRTGTVILATGHVWGSGVITKPATTKQEGEMVFTCQLCGVTKTESIAKLPLPKKGEKKQDQKGIATYTVTKVTSKVVEVAYTGAIKKTKTIAIPNEVILSDGTTAKVTSIAKSALKNNKKVTKLLIGNNVKTIGNDAFSGCTKLKTVVMGKNVTSIGTRAFKNCKAMPAMVLGTKVTTIGKESFRGCGKLKKLTIKSKKLKKVGKNAFKGIHSKAKIKVPSSKLKAYKKLLKGKGQGKKVKITR